MDEQQESVIALMFFMNCMTALVSQKYKKALLGVRLEREANHERGKKQRLVLEGGAMRGLYTAGILDVLMEEKIQVDGVIESFGGAVLR